MSKSLNPYRLQKEEFHIPCKQLAEYLLGKKLVRKFNDTIMEGRIVETECYLGGEDKASHSFAGRETPGNKPMYMPAGTAYVYMTYGMYYCFNISSKEPGAAVLLRALEPITGMECMKTLRYKKKRSSYEKSKITDLCNGPSKLCMSMFIEKNNCNMLDLAESEELWIEFDPEFNDEFDIIRTSRIGIQSAGIEWASKPLRYYILNNPHVSKRDKKAEKELLESKEINH